MQQSMFLKKIFYLIIFATSLSAAQSCNTSNDEDTTVQVDDNIGIPPLFQRKGELAKSAEWEKTKEKVAELRGKIASNPNDIQSHLRIATIYITEARITGNANYYAPVFSILDKVIAKDPNNFEAYVFKASVKMSQHQFADAKAFAEKAMSINPNNAYVYGVLVDANVELGNYQHAVAMSDKMQSIKPSLESYSRASYLREIFGDYPGAIEAMKLAVQAGGPGLESTEWARVTLGDLYLNTGKLDDAAKEYTNSLAYRPDHANAIIGLAKVEKAKKNYTAAIAQTEKAIKLVSETSYISLLAELHELNGNEAKAKEIRNDIVRLTEEGERDQEKSTVKHNGNRELAIAYMDNKQLDKAYVYAMEDLKMRPENIDANELAGWICYLKGNYEAAKTYAEKSLQTNSQNTEKLLKASMIYAKNGDMETSKELAKKAQQVNPYSNRQGLLAGK